MTSANRCPDDVRRERAGAHSLHAGNRTHDLGERIRLDRARIDENGNGMAKNLIATPRDEQRDDAAERRIRVYVAEARQQQRSDGERRQ